MVSTKTKILLALSVPTIIGTFSENGGGLSPIWNVKTSTSWGINIGGYNQYKPNSKFYGINIGLSNQHEPSSKVYGINFGAVNTNNGGTINGLNLGFVNVAKKKGGNINGLEVSVANVNGQKRKEEHGQSLVNGAQIGFVNSAKAGRCFQIGVYNHLKLNENKAKQSLLLNYHFKGKSKK